MFVYVGVCELVDELGVFGFGLGFWLGFGDDWLWIGLMKVFSDGLLIGCLVVVNEFYIDDLCNYGMFIMGEGELE